MDDFWTVEKSQFALGHLVACTFKNINIFKTSFFNFSRDLLASAKAALIAQIPAQVPQNQISGQQLFSQQKPNTGIAPFGQQPSLFQSTNTGFGQRNTAPTAGLLG